MTLDHSSLARPLAFGTQGEIPYLVYSDLAGTAMDAVMRQDGPRPVAEVLQRTRQLADAIDCAAGAGVHHGVLAPCDVILDGERTGVTGIGLAQALIRVEISAEAESPYGSPQRLAGAPPTRADDIYSLAAISLELLIGTPPDPDQEREAQGLPARRPVSRPAPHETRVFTTISGVDAGKLRAAFAAAFSEDPSARPATAAEFVASFQDAISNRHGTEEPASSVVAVPLVEEREHPPSAPASDTKPVPVSDTKPAPASDTKPVPVSDTKPAPVSDTKPAPASDTKPVPVSEAKPAPLSDTKPVPVPDTKPAPVLDTKPAPVLDMKPAPVSDMKSAANRESHQHQLQDFKAEKALARAEPIVDVALIADVTPPRAISVNEASFGSPVQSESRAFLVAAVVVISFAAGFGGGFVVGHFSRPSTESIGVSHQLPVADPQPTLAVVEDPKPIASTKRAAVEDPKPIASTKRAVVEDPKPIAATKRAAVEAPKPITSTAQTLAPISEKKVSSPAPTAAPVAPQPPIAAVESGRLRVRSTPAGANVMVDGQPSGITPLALGEVAFGAHTIEVSHPGHDTRRQRVTLSERRPSRSVDFKLRPTSVAADATTEATNTTGSLQVASRPSGAQVFVDDNLIGTTPFLLSNVTSGSRRLRIELSGFQMWTTSVQIEPSARARVSASLEPSQ